MNCYNTTFKQLVLIISLSIFVMSINGCYSYSNVLPNDYKNISPEYSIYKVEKRNGDEVYFIGDSIFQPQINESIITGLQIDSSQISIPLKDVNRIHIKRPSTTATVINVSIVSVLVGGIIYLTVQIFNGGPNMNGILSGPL